MMCSMGARNTRGFSTAVSSGSLPGMDHLTYEGIFNEIKFDVGLKTDKIVDIHHGYARYQFKPSKQDASVNDYLALFLKSSRDGADRDERPINAVICLDVSGSMGGGLGELTKSNQSRLKLSVEAIKMFISKLRPNDSIGLVTFNNSSQVIFQPIFKKDFAQKYFDELDKIIAGGGTTIRTGFNTCKKLILEFVKKNELVNCENRIIMLTDVGDNSFQNEKKFIEESSVEEGVNLTVVGISTEFRSEVCEKLKNVKGFNYFCAVNQEDIKKYVFQTFDFGFFPCAYDLNISLSSDDVKSFAVYGAPDSDDVLKYNDGFKQERTCYTVSKMKSAFPSQLEIHEDVVYTLGGLILVKLNRKGKEPFFKGQLVLNYSTPGGQFHEQVYPISYEFHPEEQFFSHQCLRSAIEGYTFASELRTLLQRSKTLKKPEIYKEYWDLLKQLEHIVPESKQKDLKSVKKIIEDYGKVKTVQVKPFDEDQYE